MWLNPRLKIGVFKFWTTEYQSTLASNLLWVCARGGRFSGAGKGRYTPCQASHDISSRSNGTGEFKDTLPDECQSRCSAAHTHFQPRRWEATHRQGHGFPASTQRQEQERVSSRQDAPGSEAWAPGVALPAAAGGQRAGTSPLQVSGTSALKRGH